MSLRPSGDDWVSLWKRKCPVESIFDGAPKGRSLRAMKNRIDKLLANDETDTANRLKSYSKICAMAEQLRPDRISRVPAPELATIISVMVAEKVTLPIAVCMAIMEHRIAVMLKGGASPEELIEVTKPWASSDDSFNPEEPKLGSLTVDLGTKLEIYKRCFWRQYFSPMLAGDLRGSARVLQITAAMQKAYADEDVIEMSTAAAHTLQEIRLACTAITALLTMHPDPSCMEALLTVQKKQNKSDKSIMTCVSNAIFANEVLEDRLDTLLQAIPAMEQYHEKYRTFQSQVADLRADESSFELLHGMCDLLVKVSSTPAHKMYESFEKEVLSAMHRMWAGVHDAITKKTAENPGRLLTSAQKAFAEATLAFNMSDEIAHYQSEVARFLRDCDTVDRANTLLGMVRSKTLRLSPEGGYKTAHAELSRDLLRLKGVRLPDEGREAVVAEVKFLVGHVSASALDWTQNEFATAVIDIIDTLVDLGARALMGVVPALRSGLAVATSLQKLAVFSEDADHDALEDMLPLMQECDGTAKAGDSNCFKANFLAADEALAFVAACRAKLAECNEVTGKFRLKLRTSRMDMVRSKLGEVMASFGEVWADKPWHDGVVGSGDKAFKALVARFGDIIGKLDMAMVSKLLEELDTAIDTAGMARVVPMQPADDPDLKDVLEAKRKARGIALEFQCLWHLTREMDKNDLRDKLQAECRAIRKRGFKEKALMHDAIFKKVYDKLSTAA